MKIGKWVKLDWKKNDDGKDLRDVKRYKENNLTLVLYTRMVYRFNLRSNFFHDKLKNWKKKFQRTKIYLRVYSYDCIFDVDITVIIVRFAYV